MSQESKIVSIKSVMESVQNKFIEKTAVYRFDLFKGIADENRKIIKIKSIGSAYIREGLKTYTVHLKTLLKDSFYLLPNNKPQSGAADYVILTRETAQNSGRKYFWNSVGEGKLLDGANHGLMQLSWDIFSQDVYMTLHPINVTELPESERANAA